MHMLKACGEYNFLCRVFTTDPVARYGRYNPWDQTRSVKSLNHIWRGTYIQNGHEWQDRIFFVEKDSPLLEIFFRNYVIDKWYYEHKRYEFLKCLKKDMLIKKWSLKGYVF